MNNELLRPPVDPRDARDRMMRRLPLIVMLLVGSAMVAWGWDYCPDVVGDFGREAYVPWRLAATMNDGARAPALYRDVGYPHGPLSPYLNAAAFRFFGPSLRTLKGANLAVIALVAALVYALMNAMSDKLAAAAATVAFLVLFAASQYGPSGNSNFLAPTSHELTHGIALTLLGLWSLEQWRQRPGYVIWAAMCGMTVGMVLLTRGEVSLAAVVGVAVGFVLLLALLAKPQATGEDVTSVWRSAGAFVLGALVPPLVAQVLLTSAGLTTREALVGLIGGVRWSINIVPPDVSAFFVIATSTVVICASAAAVGLIVAIAKDRRRRDIDAASGHVPALALAIFAVLLSGGGLIRHDGSFELLMPGVIMIVLAGVGWLPAWFASRGVNVWVPRLTAMGLLLALLVAQLVMMRNAVRARHVPIARNTPDYFVADYRGGAIDELSRFVQQQSPPTSTLICIPDGALVNFLARRVNPTPYLSFTPQAIAAVGEGRMLAEFQRHPPDLIAVSNGDPSDASELNGWIHQNYSAAAVFQVSRPTPFRITLLMRNLAPHATPPTTQ